MFRSATLSRSPDLLGLADEELMHLAADGEVRAFEAIFDRHASVAYALACRVCRTPAMAEDVIQEAFLSLWRSSDHYDPRRGSVRSWVLSAVHNRSIDALRRARVRDARDLHDPDAAERVAGPDRTETEVLRRAEAERVQAALQALPAEQREVIELAYFRGFTHSEIAAGLGLPPGTVKGRIRLGLQKLREQLEPDELVPTTAMATRAGSPR
ncbi:MAG TPA: sigma-70 family RNA polymerase sigma factor [Solirubrobacteraceae bacterium]|nr:sigma-70 family RNA polymerase sigma factor [Solirubrobacteraceae bacterium]